MCGISAVISSGNVLPDGIVERMVKKLAHRGPDASGFRKFPGCHLGHTRLSIIDLGTGDQPMTEQGGRYWIIFNGEIYNYRELRVQLIEKGRHFRTQSDTEVILSAYAEWGPDCLNQFRGIFAFVIWDTKERKLFAARDLFGEKPLYYATNTEGIFLAGSEIKAILASKYITPRLDLSAVDAYLVLGYIPPDRTIYENVRVLPPGHFMEWDKNQVTVTKYWTPRFDTLSISLDEASENLRELLLQAVRRQMVADVPVGAFLSGGLDSSTIVALMQGYSSKPVKTFSAGFGKWINELPYAKLVANRYRTEHHEIDFETPPVAELIELMATVYDEPFADSSNIPTYLISKFARQHVKVVLSGDGGDELFGGYWWYPPLVLSEKMSKSLFRWIVLRLFSRALGDRVRSIRLQSVAAGLAYRSDDPWKRNVILQTQFKPAQRRYLWSRRIAEVCPYEPGEYFRPPMMSLGLNRAFSFDLKSYLPGDILVKVDRAAMAHGLETRTPFLDRDLVEFALSLPDMLKVDKDDTKVVFRRACASYWPPELCSRGKQGFGAPYNAWLEFPDVRALSRRVFLENSPLRRLLPGLSPMDYERSTFQKWMLLILGLWLERDAVVMG